MILILCVDDKMGLQFNGRRQSRDSAVIRDVMTQGQRVWIHPSAGRLFEGLEVSADEDHLAKAKDGEICFCEDRSYLNYADSIERIVLYRWNRVYPRDMTFEFPGQWRLASSSEFPGTSHEIITREEYVK